MRETYTIESADDSVPLDPELLHELQDLLREDDDLDIGVRLKDRPPAPGEQGALPVAVEVVSAAAPLGKPFASVLSHWIDRNKVSVKVKRKSDGYSLELSGVNIQDAERLIAMLEKGNGAKPDDRD
jgi:Effector Associated Constant Component 1